MNRIDRVSAILIQLQTKKFVTAAEIAKRFCVSLRTIYRDLKALEEAGVPIGAEPGKGYYLVDGYHLPPVMFTKEEASAMLTAEKMVEKLTDHSVSENFGSAMLKIRSVLPENEKQYISDLYSNIEVFYNIKSENPNNYLSDIQYALAKKQTLTIDYKSSKNELTCGRVIEPVGICFYSLAWHLIGFCRMRNEFRDFRVDRITHLDVNKETFIPEQPLSLKQYMIDLSQQTSDLHEVTVQFEKKVATQLQSAKYYYGFIDETETESHIQMTFYSNDLNYFARWMLMYADVADVIAPIKLKLLFEEMIDGVLCKMGLQSLSVLKG